MAFAFPGADNPIGQKPGEVTNTPPTNTPKGTPKPMMANVSKNRPGRLLFDKLGETQFTSLKFSDARDGFKQQIADEPLIVKSLPEDPYADAGYIGVIPKEKDVALENQERITRFLKTPRGKDFINKQIGLQLSNTRLEGVQGLFNVGSLNINPDLIKTAIDVGSDILKNGLRTDTALTAISLVKRPATRNAISALQVYNPQNTLDQIGLDPYSGYNHYDRFGATNIMLDSDKYLNIVTQNNDGEGNRNRLVILNKSLATGLEIQKNTKRFAEKLTNGLRSLRTFTNKANTFFNQGLGIANSLGLTNSPRVVSAIDNITKGFNVANNQLAIIDRFAAPLTNNIIDQYEGGPGSLNGVGPTIIRRFDNTSGLLNQNKIKNAANSSLFKLRNLLEGEAPTTIPTQISKQYFEDTKTDLYEGYSGQPKQIDNKVYKHGNTPNYRTVLQTNRPKNRRFPAATVVDDNKITYNFTEEIVASVYATVDKQKKSTYKYFGKKGKFSTFNRTLDKFKKSNDQTSTNKDEIRAKNETVNNVVFTPIDPFTGKPFVLYDENTGNPIPDSEVILYFGSYISNFKDNYNSTWGDINYIGRSETFHTYSKFSREISFTLQIPCFNFKELRDRHQALSSLATITAGSYSRDGKNSSNTGSSKLGGVITYLKLGNYFSPKLFTSILGEPGIITNVSITIPNDSSWDIDEQLAHYLVADISFKPIHQNIPQWYPTGFLGGLGKSLNSYEEIDGEESYLQEMAALRSARGGYEAQLQAELRAAAIEAQNQALAAFNNQQEEYYKRADELNQPPARTEEIRYVNKDFEEFNGELVPVPR